LRLSCLEFKASGSCSFSEGYFIETCFSLSSCCLSFGCSFKVLFGNVARGEGIGFARTQAVSLSVDYYIKAIPSTDGLLSIDLTFGYFNWGISAVEPIPVINSHY